MNRISQVAILSVLAAVAACSSDARRDDDRSRSGRSPSSSSSSPSGGVTGDVYGSSGAAGEEGASGPTTGTLPGGRVVYFDFDSSELKPEGQALVDAWAAYLSANSGVKVRLEGHADERGTREYNVALGERRANTVQQALTASGVGASQITVSSFGEERPVAVGHDDAAWSQNRRVEIVQ
jgi:peptidoglycan-associated lipoprotein